MGWFLAGAVVASLYTVIWCLLVVAGRSDRALEEDVRRHRVAALTGT